jgi:O-antigen/teichoic acid export membrane protein
VTTTGLGDHLRTRGPSRIPLFAGPPALVQIVRLSAAFICSNLARAGTGFALSIVLGRGLGAARFGAWILCTTWASLVTVVADLGFGVLLTRDGARGDAPAAALLRSALLARLLVVVPLAAALAAAAPALSANAEAAAGLRVAALLGVAGAAYGCFGALLRSQVAWLPTVLGLETAWLAAQVGASWWILRAGGGVASLLAAAVAVQLAQIATAGALWRAVFGARAAQAALPFRATVRRALPFAITGLLANLQARVAPLLLGYLAPPVELGWFAAASRVTRVARLTPQAIFAGALPVLSQEYRRDRDDARDVTRALDRTMLAGAIVAVAAGVVFAAPLMRLIFGAPYAAAAPALVWTAISLVPALSNGNRKIFLYAAGRESAVAVWSAAAIVLEVAVGVALIPLAGSTGAAISVALAEAAIWMPLRRTAEPDAAAADEPVPATA